MEDFSKFKPVCVQLLKTPSLENITKLKCLINESSQDSIQELQEYLLFPLFIVLSNPGEKNEKTVIAVGDCSQAILKKSVTKVYKIFSDFLLQLLLLVHNPAQDARQQSEEVKLMAIQSIHVLLKSSTTDALEPLFTEQNKHLLGHLVFTLLKVSSDEEMKELRIAALDALQEVSCIPLENLGTSFVSFFPGICTHMLKSINGAVKQPHAVTTLAVEVFSQFVRLVLRNSRFEIDGSSENEWLKQTRSNLHVVFEKILKNPDMHWRVKLKLVALIGGIIEDCSSTLEPSLPLLIKKIVQFTTDDCAEVSLAAKERILNLSFPDNNLDSAVRQNLYDIVTCLPRIVTQGITHDQLVVLQELQGHLTLLGSRLEHSLIFSGLRHRLFKGLLICATIEPNKVNEKDQPFSLQYLREERVISRFTACCNMIGRHASLADTVDYLLDIVRQRDSFEKESVYVMNFVLQGATVDHSVLSTVIREYSHFLSHSIEDTKNDVVLGQLLLLVIGQAALLMQNSFSPLLLTALKPVLEKAGNPNFTESGLGALRRMAEALQISSVSQLLEENADYFAPQLAFQLRNIMRYPRAVDLLRALLLFSEIRMEKWLEQMVRQALKGLDKSHSVRALPYTQVLELYTKAIHNTRPPGPVCARPLSKGECMTTEELQSRITEYKTSIHITETLADINEDELIEGNVQEPMELEELEMEQETSIPPPHQVTLVAEILDRCTQLLPQSSNEDLYATLMRTICLSVEVLSPHDDVFLPKVHQLWDPLRNQLLGSTHLKQRQAYEIFISLIRRCPDFVRHRAVTEAIPKLVTFLKTQATVSRGRSSRAHIASQAYKLQKSVLSSTGMLVEFLDPPILTIGSIIQAITLYLSNQQIHELQNLAKENLIAIAKYHSGSVWLALHSMASRRTITLPGFPSILVDTAEEENEFTANAEELVAKLFPVSLLG